MSEQFVCPRCAAIADRDDRFCGGCGLRRPVVPGAALVPAAPEAALAGVTQPIAGLPVAAAAAQPAPSYAGPGLPRMPTGPAAQSGPDSSRRGAGSIALSAIGLTFRLVNGLLTIISGIAIAVIAHQHLGEDKAGWILAGGVGWALYGLYIVVTRRSYWVSSLFTYLVPIVVIVYLASGAGAR